MANLVVLEDVAAEPAPTQVYGVVRQVLDQIVAYDVAVAQAEEHAGAVLVEESAVVDVIIDDLVVGWMALHRAEVLAPYQHHSACARVADFVVPDEIPRVVALQIDAVAADGVEDVVLDATVVCTG